MFLRCSYFFGNLSLNVLINMVLTQKNQCISGRGLLPARCVIAVIGFFFTLTHLKSTSSLCSFSSFSSSFCSSTAASSSLSSSTTFFCIAIVTGDEANSGKSRNGLITGQRNGTDRITPTSEVLNELSQKVLVGQVLQKIQNLTKPDQPGLSSSICLEVMCVQTQLFIPV